MAREPPGAILNPAPGALTNLLRLISNNDAIVGLATRGSPILAYRPNGLKKPEPASRSVVELEALRALLEAANSPTDRSPPGHGGAERGAGCARPGDMEGPTGARPLTSRIFPLCQQEIDDQVLLLGSLQF